MLLNNGPTTALNLHTMPTHDRRAGEIEEDKKATSNSARNNYLANRSYCKVLKLTMHE
jgi:hypothetical protein